MRLRNFIDNCCLRDDTSNMIDLSEGKAASQLALMFPPALQQTPRQKADVEAAIDWARKNLKRKDRVIWFLKRVRIRMAAFYAGQSTDRGSQDSYRNYNQILSKYMRADPLAYEDATNHSVGSPAWKTDMAHLISMDLPEIDQIEWLNQDSPTLVIKMRAAEQKWQATRGRHVDMSKHNTDATRNYGLAQSFLVVESKRVFLQA